MMMRTFLIGLAAGLAAALLFAGLISGSPLALPLFLLSPLPISIAGLGFGTLAGAVAAGAAAALIGAVFGPVSAVLYLAIFGAPIAWGAHLVGLSRPDPARDGDIEWFPLGMVLFRLALAIGAGVVVAGALLGFDPSTLLPQTVAAFQELLTESGADALPAEDLTAFVRLSIALTPVTTAALTLGITLFSLWLGGRITRLSGLLRRGWTPIPLVRLPPLALPLLVMALLLVALPGGSGHIAAAFAGALGFAFVVTGYGRMHVLLAGKPGRLALLLLLYLASFLFLIPILAMLLLGIASLVLDFRQSRAVGSDGSKS